MHIFIDAFRILSSRRSYGMSANPISLSDILVYAQYSEVEDVDEFITLMCEMDCEYMTVQNEKSKQQSEASK